MEDIRMGQKIFYELLCNGKIEAKKRPDLFQAYSQREEIMNLVKSQGEIAQCRVERFGNVIYFMPDMGNIKLGYTKAELKKKLCKGNATDKDYYLSQFVILTLLSEFYAGQGSCSKSRTFLQLGELQNLISQRLRDGLLREQEREADERYGLDYKSMSEAFEALRSADGNQNRQKTTKEGFLNAILHFLEEQELIVFIREDDRIQTTEKLDAIMEMWVLNQNNYTRIMETMGVVANE